MSDILKVLLVGVAITAAICIGFMALCAFLELLDNLKKMRKRDKYLLAAIINLFWYCVAVLLLTAHDHAVPDSLTVAWFSAWTAELALLANIKIKGKDE